MTPRSLHYCPKLCTPTTSLLDIEKLLQLYNQLPLVLANVAPEELLECIDTLPANSRIQNIVFFQVATVHGLIVTLDLDGDGGLTPLAYLHGSVTSTPIMIGSFLLKTATGLSTQGKTASIFDSSFRCSSSCFMCAVNLSNKW